MSFNKDFIADKLRRWEKYLIRFKLPSWEEIPSVGLYMEQTVSLLKQYLDYLPPELKDERLITASAINNYVRTKVMPKPTKKKYYRIHIAYLIIICTLKQSLNISTIEYLLPIGLSENDVKIFYDSFVQRHTLSTDFFVKQVKLAGASVLDHDETSEMTVASVEELITSSAIVSGFARLLSEKLLLLDNQSDESDKCVESNK